MSRFSYAWLNYKQKLGITAIVSQIIKRLMILVIVPYKALWIVSINHIFWTAYSSTDKKSLSFTSNTYLTFKRYSR